MQKNPQTALAERIRDRLANQGFLSFGELRPLIVEAISQGFHGGFGGILIDGFPQTVEQKEAFTGWVLETGLWTIKPDLVLSLRVGRQRAKERYLARGRDGNDSAEKFERRFDEYMKESLAVEALYEQKGLLIKVGGILSSQNISI